MNLGGTLKKGRANESNPYIVILIQYYEFFLKEKVIILMIIIHKIKISYLLFICAFS